MIESLRPSPLRRRLTALRHLAVAAAASGALSCASSGPYVRVEDYPQPAPEADYRIASGDVVAIRVWNQDAMSNPAARVRDDGRISVPFLQDVEAAGSTPAQLSQLLQSRLKSFVVNPVVTVAIEQVHPLRVSVVGKVARPGQYELDRGAGVLAALAAAGGLNDYAHRDAIFVLRRTPDGKQLRIRFRWTALTQAVAPAATFRLQPGDAVVAE